MDNDRGKKPHRQCGCTNGTCGICANRTQTAPCANCERLESGNKMMRSALETIFNRRMSMYLKYEDMIEDQIKSADECLKAIAKE